MWFKGIKKKKKHERGEKRETEEGSEVKSLEANDCDWWKYAFIHSLIPFCFILFTIWFMGGLFVMSGIVVYIWCMLIVVFHVQCLLC